MIVNGYIRLVLEWEEGRIEAFNDWTAWEVPGCARVMGRSVDINSARLVGIICHRWATLELQASIIGIAPRVPCYRRVTACLPVLACNATESCPAGKPHRDGAIGPVLPII